MPDYYRITELGDSALLVEFEQSISTEINSKVHKLDHAVRQNAGHLIEFTIPAYCSLAIGYDRGISTHDEVRIIIENTLQKLTLEAAVKTGKRYEIPVCFDDQFARDLERITEHCELEWTEIKSILCGQDFHVFMIGFVAGFPYMGELPEQIKTPRLEVPRKDVEKGSVAIAEKQCGIYPTTSPGGWNIVGRTPLPILSTDYRDPFLLHPADQVRFTAIDMSEFHRIDTGLTKGKLRLSDFYG